MVVAGLPLEFSLVSFASVSDLIPGRYSFHHRRPSGRMAASID